MAVGIARLKGGTGERLLLAAVLGIGTSVRLSGLDVGWFLQDQVRDGMVALGILSRGEFPLIGPQAALSTVNLVGPLYYYLIAIPYGLSPNPEVGVGFLNILGVVSIYLTYRLGTEVFGPPVGLVAAALYAVFPMAVLSGKALWNPGFIPFFSTLFLWTLWRFLLGRHPWTLALVLFLLGVLLQIHMSGAIFVVLLPIALLLYRPPLRRCPLMTGLLGVALLYLPYVIFEIGHGFPDASKLFAWTGKNPSASFFDIAGRGFWMPFLLPERLATALPTWEPPPLFAAIQRTELLLLGLGLLALVAFLIKAKDRRPSVLLGLWFILPFTIVPHNRIAVMWYYFDILYPAQFLLIGLLIQVLLALYPKARVIGLIQSGLPLAVAVFTGTIVAVQVWFCIGFERTVEQVGILNLTKDILLSSPNSGTKVMLATMPLHDKRALAKRFLDEFGADHATLERQAHGAVYQLFREDKGFLFQTLSPRTPTRLSDPALQYLIIRDDLPASLAQGYEARVGAYRIVAYHPAIRYESWRWSVSPGPIWWSPMSEDSGWSALALPARQLPDPSVYAAVPYSRWPGNAVVFRGWMEGSSVGGPVWLVFNIRDPYAFPHAVGAIYVNGLPLKPAHTISYNGVNSRNIDVVVDVTTALRAGLNFIAFEITGGNEEFDLDLYELRLAHEPTGR